MKIVKLSSAGGRRTLKVSVVLLTLSITLQSQKCDERKVDASLDLETPQKTGQGTEFAFRGHGFPGETQIHLFVVNQPAPLPDSAVSLGQVVTTEKDGTFIAHWTANYLVTDNDKKRKPYFEATDKKGCSAIKETSASYWYPE